MAKKMCVRRGGGRERNKGHEMCGSGDMKVGYLKNAERKEKGVNYAARRVFPPSHLF